MSTKKEWIKCYTTGRFQESNPEVINFIANILFKADCDDNSVYNLFANGYCYYFATILKEAFNRGDIYWHKGYSHIVWVDINNIPYDIGGVFADYNKIKEINGEKNDLVPIAELNVYKGINGLNGFKHVINF